MGRVYRKRLSDQEMAFVNAYVERNFSNAVQSALDAGYSESTAKKKAHCWVTGSDKPHICAEIQRMALRKRSRAHFNDEVLLDQLLDIALLDVYEIFDDEGGLAPFHTWPEHITRAVKEIDIRTERKVSHNDEPIDVHITKVRFWDKIKSIELLGKNKRLWDRVIESDETVDKVLQALLEGRKRVASAKQDGDD